MLLTGRLMRLLAVVGFLALPGGVARGVYVDIPLVNPGFELGDTGWFAAGDLAQDSHLANPIPDYAGEVLGDMFGYTLGIDPGVCQTVSETFATATVYHFTGLTGKYGTRGSADFQIGYVTTPGDSTTFVSVASAIQPTTGMESETPDFGWNLRGGVYHTAAAGPERVIATGAVETSSTVTVPPLFLTSKSGAVRPRPVSRSSSSRR